jgi:hypothetical protein
MNVGNAMAAAAVARNWRRENSWRDLERKVDFMVGELAQGGNVAPAKLPHGHGATFHWRLCLTIMFRSLLTILVLLSIIVVAAQTTGARLEPFPNSTRRAWEERQRMRHLERVAQASADAREFRGLYPAAKIEPLFSYDGPSEYFAKYDQLLLTAGLYQRYVLTLYVPFKRGTTVPEKATFSLVEETQDGFQTSVPAEKHVWDCIRWSGDLRAFGVETLTNSPVEGFERFWKPK